MRGRVVFKSSSADCDLSVSRPAVLGLGPYEGKFQDLCCEGRVQRIPKPEVAGAGYCSRPLVCVMDFLSCHYL